MKESPRAAAVSRRSVLPMVGAMVFALTACGGASGEPTAASNDAACDFDGSTERVSQEGTGESLEVSALRHEITAPGCEESVVFVFDSLPGSESLGYDVFYRDTPFEAPDGEVEVGGDALLEVVMRDTHAADDLSPAEPASNGELVVDLVRPPEVPGGSLWLIGVDEERPFTVALEETPEPSLVVTIGAAAGS